MYKYQLICSLLLLPVLAWAALYNVGDTVTVVYNGSPSTFNFSLAASTQARFDFSSIQGTEFYVSFTSDKGSPAGLYIPIGVSSYMFDTRAAGCPLQARNITLYIEGQAGQPGSLNFTSILVSAAINTGVNALTVPSGDSLASLSKYVIQAAACQTANIVVEGAIPSLTVDCSVNFGSYVATSACSGGQTTYASKFIAIANGTGLTSLSVGCGPSGNYVLNLLTTSPAVTVDYETTYKCTQTCSDNGGICYQSSCVCPSSFQSGANCDVISYETLGLNEAFDYKDGTYVKIDIPSSVSSSSVLTVTYTTGSDDGYVYLQKNAPATVGQQPAQEAVLVSLKGGQKNAVTSACISGGLSGYITAYFQVGSEGTITFSTTTATPSISSGSSTYTSTGSPLYFKYTVKNIAANVVVTLTNNTAVTLLQQDAYLQPAVFSLATVATDNGCTSPSSTSSTAFAYVNRSVVYQSLDWDSPYVFIYVTAESGTRFTINIAEDPVYCDGGCNENGVCIQGTCVCSEYYSGASCDQDEPVFDANEYPLATVGAPFSGTVDGISFRTRVPAGFLPGLNIATNTAIELDYSDDASDLSEDIIISSAFNGFVYSNECPVSRADSFYRINFVAPQQTSSSSYSVTPFSVNVTLAEGDNTYNWKTSKEVQDYAFSHAFFQSSTCTAGKSFTVQVKGQSIDQDSTDVRVLYNVDEGCNNYIALLGSYSNGVFTANIPQTTGCLPFIVIVDISPSPVPASINYVVSVSSQNLCGNCYSGTCEANVCVCNDGFYGADCSQSNLACLQTSTLSKCKTYVNYPYSFAGSLSSSCSAESLLVDDYSVYNNITKACQDAATQVNCQSALYPCSSTNGVATTKYAGPSSASCTNLLTQCGNLYSSQQSRIAAIGDVYALCGISPISVGSTVVIPTTAPVTISPTNSPSPSPAPQPTSAPTPSTTSSSAPTPTPSSSPVNTAAGVSSPSILLIFMCALMSAVFVGAL